MSCQWIVLCCNYYVLSCLYCTLQKCSIKFQIQKKRCPIVFQGDPSNFKVTRDKKLLTLIGIERFRTVTPVWIHPWLWNDVQSPIESTKTTSMEDVSTGVLEKIKNIQEVKIKPQNDMMYQDIYNCICQNTKMKIYYPLCQTYSPTVV